MKRNELGGEERQKSAERLSVIKVLEGSVGSRCYFWGVSKCSGIEMGCQEEQYKHSQINSCEVPSAVPRESD